MGNNNEVVSSDESFKNATWLSIPAQILQT